MSHRSPLRQVQGRIILLQQPRLTCLSAGEDAKHSGRQAQYTRESNRYLPSTPLLRPGAERVLVDRMGVESIRAQRLISTLQSKVARARRNGPSMEDASEGFERIAGAILEMHQRTGVLLAEHRHLLAELAALRQGAGIMFATLG